MPASPYAAAADRWKELEFSTDVKSLQAFIGEFEGNPFASLARARISSLEQPPSMANKPSVSKTADVQIGLSAPPSPSMPITETFALLTPITTEQFREQSNRSAARTALERADFEKAERIGTVRGWHLFLKKHPDAEHKRVVLARLQSLNDTGNPSVEEGKLKLGGAHVRQLQQSLARLGFSAGNVDGNLGPKTRREIARYQRVAGLDPTGYLNFETLAQLGIPNVQSASTAVSAGRARSFSSEDLRGIETDERVIRAADCLSDREFVYGEFDARIFVAVYSFNVHYVSARDRAKECGAILATITSKAENDFVYGLFSGDGRFFQEGHDGNGFYRNGPIIGLIQDSAGKEPDRGWRWDGGEPLKYKNWLPGAPDEWRDGADYARFGTYVEGNGYVLHADARTWIDFSDMDGSNGFILEFK